MQETLAVIEMVAKVISVLAGIIISLVCYTFFSLSKKVNVLEENNASNYKDVKGLFEKFEAKIDKNIEKIEKNFTEKIDKQEGLFIEKTNKTSFEINMINKQLTILENEYKHLNRRVNKLDGFDSTEY